MKFFLKTLALLCLLLLSGCGLFEDEIIQEYRYSEDGTMYSPSDLNVVEAFLPNMKCSAVKLVRLDNKLNPVDTVDFNRSGVIDAVYFLEDIDFPSPYVLLLSYIPMEEDSSKLMEFSQYEDISKIGGDVRLNLYSALAADRIKILVQEKGNSFAVAESLAMDFLAKSFDADLSGIKKITSGDAVSAFPSLEQDNFYKPYAYCRHGNSDSVFYKDYKELREVFKKGEGIDSVIGTRVADELVSHLEIKVVAMIYGQTFLNDRSRDGSYITENLSCSFWNKYFFKDSLDSNATFGTIRTIENSISEYDGRHFVMDGNSNSGILGRFSSWRLTSPQEDSVGICLFKTDTLLLQENFYYLCKAYDMEWTVATPEQVLERLYSECDYRNIGNVGIYLDTVYSCKQTDLHTEAEYHWVKDENWAEGNEDAMEETLLDAKATALYGRCKGNSSLDGSRALLDSVMIRCKNGMWRKIDSLEFEFGICGKEVYDGTVVALADSSFWGCHGYDSEWLESNAPTYYDEPCDRENEGRIVVYGEEAFICEPNIYGGWGWGSLSNRENRPTEN